MTSRLFGHALALSNSNGMFEHADHNVPRREHGYCTDDVARLLVVTAREPERSEDVSQLARMALRFVADAQSTTGRSRNRRAATGRWRGGYGVHDCWGRSVWALGTAARRMPDDMAALALPCFERCIRQRSPHRRAMAFAALGASEVVASNPNHAGARGLLADAITAVGALPSDQAWPWPERRLSYANAALAEALLAAGAALGRGGVVDDGLRLLRWLLDRETVDGHLSPTPVGGAGRDDGPGRFDQQPIEVAAMADACARAHALTGDDRWRDGVEAAIAWFAGENDLGVVMFDADSHGGYDGLTPCGANLNQGAESTLALIATLQHARTAMPAGGAGSTIRGLIDGTG